MIEKSRLTKYLNDIEGFKPLNEIRAPEGISAEILFDIWDLVLKIGQVRTRVIELKIENLHVAVFNFGEYPRGTAGLTLIKRGEEPRTRSLIHNFELVNNLLISWDSRFSVNEVEAVLLRIKKNFFGKSFPKRSNKLLLPQFTNSSSKGKVKVSDLFKQKKYISISLKCDVYAFVSQLDEPGSIEIMKRNKAYLVYEKKNRDSVKAYFEKVDWLFTILDKDKDKKKIKQLSEKEIDLLSSKLCH